MKDTCVRGHDLNDPKVAYLYKGKRMCRLCRKDRKAGNLIPINPELAGMTRQERQAYHARKRYYAGREMPEKQPRFKPGIACVACQLPIATRDDKHSNYSTHRWCRPGDAWREGEPCKECKKPVSLEEKHCREKAHDACVKKRAAIKGKRKKPPKPLQFQKLQRVTKAERKPIEVLHILDTEEEKRKHDVLLRKAQEQRTVLNLSRWA